MVVCSAINCKSGYKTEKTPINVSFHSFPLKDEERLRAWIKAVGRKDFTPTSSSRICSKHFLPEDFVTESEDRRPHRQKTGVALQKKRLKQDAIPSVFEGIPSHAKVTPKRRSTVSSSYEARFAASESAAQEAEEIAHEKELEKDRIGSFENFLLHLKGHSLPPTVQVLTQDEKLVLASMDLDKNPPSCKFSLLVDKDLQVSASLEGKRIPKSIYSGLMGPEVTSFSKFLQLLERLVSFSSEAEDTGEQLSSLETSIQWLKDYLSSDDLEESEGTNKLRFLLEQLKLATLDPKARRFSQDLTVFSYLQKSTSSQAYRALLDSQLLTLPSESHLRRITGKISPESGDAEYKYLKARYQNLSGYEVNVIILVDEIYVAQRVEFSSAQGKLVGLTEDADVASTVLCLMISSISSKYRDIVAMVPISKISAEKIEDAFMKVLKLVSKVGFNVIAVCLDNHASNQKFYKNLGEGSMKTSVPNPIDPDKPLFLIFDSVHNLKNIYNNFQKKKLFKFPEAEVGSSAGSTAEANFHHIRELFEMEALMRVKHAFKLNPKVLDPKSLEKTKVSLCLAIFDESTIWALKYYANQKGKPWNGTAAFLEKVEKLWKILNVKVPSLGKHKRDLARDPVTSEGDWKLAYLEEFAEFCDKWMEEHPNNCLTKETKAAVTQTCRAIVEMARFCLLNLGLNYILLGKIQSDPLEKRFSWFRQLAGGNYYISMKQLIEGERKIKAISLMKFSGMTAKDMDKYTPADTEVSEASGETLTEIEPGKLIKHLEDQGSLDCSDIAATYYVAGALVRSELRSRKICESCKDFLLESDEDELPDTGPEGLSAEALAVAKDFLGDRSRGGLLKPSTLAFSICLKASLLFSALEENSELRDAFLKSKQQESLFEKSFWAVAEHDDELIDLFSMGVVCEKGHTFGSRILKRFFHVMIKNLLKKLSSDASVEATSRKALKLSGKGGSK